MIPIINLLNDIDVKINRLSNLRGQYIPNETKIEVLNIAQTKLVLKKLNTNNNYQLGFDTFTKRYQDLQMLVVPNEEVGLTKVPGDLLNSYKVSLSSLAYKMIIPIQSYCIANRGNCKQHILDVIEIVKHEDIRVKLSSPHYEPNFQYQEIIGSISADTMYVYGDEENSFTITNLFISYLRYPVLMDIAGYTHLDNTASTTVDCELEAYLENELVELAVEEIADATGNQEQSQSSRLRTKEAE